MMKFLIKSLIKRFYFMIIWYLPYDIRYAINSIINRKSFKRNQNLRLKEVSGRQASLKGFDDNKCIFVHIPKVAGVSINKALFNNLGGGHRSIKDYQLIFNKRDFYSYYKFTFVRNPWDRLVSAYFFLKEGGFHQTDRVWFQDNLREYNSFEEFILCWLNKKNIYSEIHFVPQFEFITNHGKICVDAVFKLEKFYESMQIIQDNLNLDCAFLAENKTQNRERDYRKYYNEKTREVVRQAYYKDITMFGYEF